jgi:GTP-binding protein HflX
LFFDRAEAGSNGVLLHLRLKDETHDGTTGIPSARAAEFAELARSAGVVAVGDMDVVRQKAHPRYFVGEGKLNELKSVLKESKADLLLVSRELSAGQQRNLETELNTRVMTRTELILKIFADRAQTHEGQLQVELAQLRHAQTRLVRGWTHLDRQKGGIGLRGAGEKQIELDQRMLGARIKKTVQRLHQVEARRARNRKRRHRSETVTVSLVGYTNAGKSTLFNELTKARVDAEDKLFATLDPTMRKLDIPGIGEVVLADTVGFVSDLPHMLVDAFKATLEEVANADLLLHVVDANDADPNLRIQQVNEVLKEIGATKVPVCIVMNKCDLLDPDQPLPVAATDPAPTFVSALTGKGLSHLVDRIGELLGVSNTPRQVLLPASAGDVRAWLYQQGAVIDEQLAEDGRISLKIRVDTRTLARLEKTPDVVVTTRGDLLRGDQPTPRISP